MGKYYITGRTMERVQGRGLEKLPGMEKNIDLIRMGVKNAFNLRSSVAGGRVEKKKKKRLTRLASFCLEISPQRREKNAPYADEPYFEPYEINHSNDNTRSTPDCTSQSANVIGVLNRH